MRSDTNNEIKYVEYHECKNLFQSEKEILSMKAKKNQSSFEIKLCLKLIIRFNTSNLSYIFQIQKWD